MKVKKLQLLSAVGMLALLLAGCGQTANTDVSPENYTKTSDSAVLAADAAEALSQEYTAFDIDCSVPTQEDFPDTYYHINYDYNRYTKEEAVEKLKALMDIWNLSYSENLIIEEKSDAADVGEAVGEQYGYTYDAAYESEGWRAEVGTTGSYLINRLSFCATNMMGEEQVARYRLNAGDDISGVSYTLAGEEYPLTEAVAMADGYVEQIRDVFYDENTTFRLRTVLVYQSQIEDWDPYIKNGDYAYLLYYERVEHGLPYDENCEEWMAEMPFFNADYLYIQVTEPGEVSYAKEFFNRNNYEAIPEEDGILPLSYALARAETELAQYSDFVLSSAELHYCTLNWQWDGNTFYYEPWWCLQVMEGARVEGGGANDPRAVVYVNAFTGEAYFQSNIPGMEVGTERYFENPNWSPENPNAQWRKKNGV